MNENIDHLRKDFQVCYKQGNWHLAIDIGEYINCLISARKEDSSKQSPVVAHDPNPARRLS